MIIAAVLFPGILLLGVALVWLRRSLMVVTVTGRSMEPSLSAGDRLLVRRTPAATVRPGQIVVLRWPEAVRLQVVKRVAAVGGDPIPESVRAAAPGLVRVPAGHVVVLGDNSALSHDSRQLGPLPMESLLGVVRRRLSTADPGQAAGPAGAPAPAEAWAVDPQWSDGSHPTKEKKDAEAH